MYKEQLEAATYKISKEAENMLRKHLKEVGGKMSFKLNELKVFLMVVVII